MDARAWVHLAVMIVPVAILTVFNFLGMRPEPELAAALSALTTAAAVLTQARRPKGRALSSARKPRSDERPKKQLTQRGAPARVVVAVDDDHRVP